MTPMSLANPYHRLQWSDGFTISARSAPYDPSSGSVMLQFVPTSLESHQTSVTHVGVGLLQASSCFRFDFQSARVGCDSTSSDCIFNMTGLRWDRAAQAEVPTRSEFFTVPACHDAEGCKLASIVAGPSSRLVDLTSINIDVQANGLPINWWLDDMGFSWTDISCSAAACRSNVRDITDLRNRRALSSKRGPKIGPR